jgi:hypothetical protein
VNAVVGGYGEDSRGATRCQGLYSTAAAAPKLRAAAARSANVIWRFGRRLRAIFQDRRAGIAIRIVGRFVHRRSFACALEPADDSTPPLLRRQPPSIEVGNGLFHIRGEGNALHFADLGKLLAVENRLFHIGRRLPTVIVTFWWIGRHGSLPRQVNQLMNEYHYVINILSTPFRPHRFDDPHRLDVQARDALQQP